MVAGEHNFDYPLLEDTRELVNPIAQYPTTGQLILDTTFKDILVSLRNTLQRDKSEVSDMIIELATLRTKWGNMQLHIMSLWMVTMKRIKKNHKLKLKKADLEDRSSKIILS